MDIKTFKQKAIRSRYVVQSQLFSDVFYTLFDGLDVQEEQSVYVLKFHDNLVSPQFVDYCIESLKDYLYQPIQGLFELIDYEFDGGGFYIFYKHHHMNLTSLELYLNQIRMMPDRSKKRYKLLLDIAHVLYLIEQKQLVFGSFSLNNIFVSADGAVVLGPAKINLICLEYFMSKVSEFDGSIFLTPEFLADCHVSTKTDVYAFGVLAFYLVTLQWPYEHKDSLVRLKQCFMDGPKSCSEYSAKISDKLNFFIMKSIQLDPQLRWHSFRLILGILEGKETVKFEKLSNRLGPVDSFTSDIEEEKRSKFSRIVSIFSNGFAVLVLFVFLYFGYVSYFMKYDVIRLPNLLDAPLSEAKQALLDLGLDPKSVHYNYHPTIPEGHVVRLEPPIGRSIKQGRSVKLFVSKGRQEVLVPSFIGKTKQEISFILDGSNIEVEEMPPIFSLDIDFGKVVSQIPLPNQYMFDNGRVQLVFSKGTPVSIEVLEELDDDYNKMGVEFIFMNDMDSVQFDVIEQIGDDQRQELYSGIHYAGDHFQDEFIVNKTSFIVIHLNGEEIFSNEISDGD